MTATIKNEPFAFAGFAEMSEQEMLAVDGGGTVAQALWLTTACTAVANAPWLIILAGVTGGPVAAIGATLVIAGVASLSYGKSTHS